MQVQEVWYTGLRGVEQGRGAQESFWKKQKAQKNGICVQVQKQYNHFGEISELRESLHVLLCGILEIKVECISSCIIEPI